MIRIKTISTLPANFSAFCEEVATGLKRLYGEAGAAEYRLSARRSVAANLVHPQVRALALYDGKTVAGIIMALLRNEAAEIYFMHLLQPYQGRGLEHRLIDEAIRILQKEQVTRIVSECMVMGNLDLNCPFEKRGFEKTQRQLMAADLSLSSLSGASPIPVRPLERVDRAKAAQCIVDAYVGHPGAQLHSEVQTLSSAIDFLARVESGAYGLTQPNYSMAVWSGEECAGVIVGCQVAPESGFVLQVVVAPHFRHRSFGTALIQAQAASFRAAGYDRVLLGVTCDNPARRLYEKLGFEVIQPVTAYVWSRDGQE